MKDNPIDPDSPLWTEADFTNARSPADVLPPHLAGLLVRKSRKGLREGVASQRALARGWDLAA